MQAQGERVKLCTDSNPSSGDPGAVTQQHCITVAPLCFFFYFHGLYTVLYGRIFTASYVLICSIDLTAEILKPGVIPHISGSCADGVSVGPLSISKNA